MDYATQIDTARDAQMRLCEMLAYSAPEPESIRCRECSEELREFYSVQYCDKVTGAPIGCDECIDENENDGTYICDCKHFTGETETVYTSHGTDCVVGCSGCVTRILDGFNE